MNLSRPRILIIGVGRIGEALAKIIAPTQQAEIALFDTDASKISHGISLPQLTLAADFIFLCIPSTAVRPTLQMCSSHLKPGAIVVCLVKGLDGESGATMYELLQQMLPKQVDLVILGGPMLSGELLQGKVAYGVAGTTPVIFSKLEELFRPTILRVAYCADAQGVSVVGVLKNVYALGLGIAQALAVGDNARGWLGTHALQEMSTLITRLGGQPATTYSIAGLGDLLATGYSQHSRNRTAGEELVRTGHVSVPSEGLLTLPILIKRLGSYSTFPFLETIVRVVIDHDDARQAFDIFLQQGTTSGVAQESGAP
ncbi:MAG: NAD(P)H-dependent glycerol-3-phosphate dehydrogenase [Candidatus Andersenbacteria bacterium]